MMTEQEAKLNQACDRLLEKLGSDMQALGAEPARVVDRVLTFGAAHIVAWHGSARAAEVLHALADNVGQGAFARLDPTAPGNLN